MVHVFGKAVLRWMYTVHGARRRPGLVRGDRRVARAARQLRGGGVDGGPAAEWEKRKK